ncbi:hypothetical protein N8Z24_00300 [bacterium]|nr:hypothetical protein [bacterium]
MAFRSLTDTDGSHTLDFGTSAYIKFEVTGELTLSAASGDYTRIGTGTATQATANTDLLVSDVLEVAGVSHLLGNVNISGNLGVLDDKYISFGDSPNSYLKYSTAQDAHSLMLSLHTDSDTLIVTTTANLNKNHHPSNEANPTLKIFSAADVDVDATQWLSAAHNGTDAIFSTGTGKINLLPVAGSITQIGAGTPGNLGTPTNNDAYIGGRLEIDGPMYVDNIGVFGAGSRHGDDVYAAYGSASDAGFMYSTSQTPDSFLILTGNQSNSVIICNIDDSSFDFEHALQINPTLFGQSANQSTTEWWSQTHDQTDAFFGIGSGSKVTEHEAPVSLINDAYFDLPTASAGFGFISVGDGEYYAQIQWATDGTVLLINNSADVEAINTIGKFCIFDNGTSVRVRNRLGSTVTVMFNYHFTTSP